MKIPKTTGKWRRYMMFKKHIKGRLLGMTRTLSKFVVEKFGDEPFYCPHEGYRELTAVRWALNEDSLEVRLYPNSLSRRVARAIKGEFGGRWVKDDRRKVVGLKLVLPGVRMPEWR